jgi:hypoxanthine phosphoribosyltransferase
MVATITGEARITQPLNVSLKGKNVLIVDDVADTGETIRLVKEHVKSMLAKDIRIAVIDYKKTSKFVPDYYAAEMEGWKWIVYPWSLKEDIKGLIANKAKNIDEAAKILEEYGLKLGYEELREIIEE